MGLTRIRAEQISDIDYKQAVRVVTTAPVTLSGGAPSQVDTVNLNAGDRILVTAQGTASQNGLYDVESVGSGSNGTWVRTSDANATGEVSAGMVVMVTEGSNYADTMWKLITNDPIVIGTTGLEFVPNPSTSFTTIQANGTAVLANAATSTLTLTPGNNITITGNNASDTVTIGMTNAPSFTGNITGGNLNITGDISVTGNLTIGANLNVVNVNEFVGASGNISFLGNLLPATSGNVNYDLGLPGIPWGNIYATNFSTTAGNFYTGNLLANVNISAVGNITGNYINGNGAFLTGLPAGYANSNAAAYFASGTVSTAIETTNIISATGNITGGNIVTAGVASIGGFTIGANTITSQGPTLTIDPNASGGVDGEVVIAGNLQVQGNVTYINSNVVSINDLVFNTANNAATASQANGGGLGVGPVDAEYATWLYNSTANIWASNIGISAVGNISAGNLSGTLTTPAQPNITSVGNLTSLQFSNSVTPITANIGQLFWDTGEHTVTLGMENGVQQQIGLENYMYVKASSAITNGQAVMFTGANGTNILAAPANTASAGFKSEYIIGVATQDIALNAFGYITVFGLVHNLNTNAWTVGDILWVDNTTPGALTNTQPSDPNYQIQMAAVTKKAGGDGHIQVRVTPFYQLDRLRNVQTTSPTNGQALIYDGANLVWVNGTPANATYATTAGTVTTNAQPNITSVGTLTSLTVTGNTQSGNLLTTGYVSATGNIITATVLAPTVQNGGTGITMDAGYPGYITFFNGTGQKAILDDQGNLSVVGNVYSGNISTAGNITGNYIFGNGSLLTGIITSVANINNGTSNISVYENGNIAVSVSNVANTVVFDPVSTLSTVDFSTTGNIYGNVLTGNGAGITGIASIGNVGNCSVEANLADGNVSISADGVANLATFNLGTMTMLGAYANPNYFNINVSVIGNVNGMMVGPIALGPEGNIQVPDSSRIVIL